MKFTVHEVLPIGFVKLVKNWSNWICQIGSRLGLIVKVKESGVKKRRVILDLRRSGGNAKATLPEKLILPRPKDAIDMLRNIYAREGGKGDLELVLRRVRGLGGFS